MYSSQAEAFKIAAVLLGLVAGIITFRCIMDLISAFEDPEIGIKEALKKCKKRIFAAAVALGCASLVAILRGYYG